MNSEDFAREVAIARANNAYVGRLAAQGLHAPYDYTRLFQADAEGRRIERVEITPMGAAKLLDKAEDYERKMRAAEADRWAARR